eukprot:SM000001S04470  [mRNA]  locus=s1:348993:351928:- [translate_table: standard]
MFALHLGPQPSGQLLLLAARKSRWRPCSASYAISAAGGGDPLLSRLRANFHSTQFTGFDDAPDACGGGGGDGGTVTVAVDYALRVSGTRGPRGPGRMTCTLLTQVAAAGAGAGDGRGFRQRQLPGRDRRDRRDRHRQGPSRRLDEAQQHSWFAIPAAVANCFEYPGSDCGGADAGGLEPMVLKSKEPRWLEEIQVPRRLPCYYFDFTSVTNPNSAVPGDGSSATGAAAAPSSSLYRALLPVLPRVWHATKASLGLFNFNSAERPVQLISLTGCLKADIRAPYVKQQVKQQIYRKMEFLAAFLAPLSLGTRQHFSAAIDSREGIASSFLQWPHK